MINVLWAVTKVILVIVYYSINMLFVPSNQATATRNNNSHITVTTSRPMQWRCSALYRMHFNAMLLRKRKEKKLQLSFRLPEPDAIPYCSLHVLQLQLQSQLLRNWCEWGGDNVYGERDAFVIHGLTQTLKRTAMEWNACGVAFNSQIRKYLLDSAIVWRGSNENPKEARWCYFRLSFTLDTTYSIHHTEMLMFKKHKWWYHRRIWKFHHCHAIIIIIDESHQ